ncbi:hypothetical protein BGZ58_007887 [Dissophora ornata]|nr:hypothetical protein BGZ58_007876 [Dissophora ornata]KAF8940070.1 hypothetical protein BGZ58_007887 [Dissophora ornata]
MPGVSNACINDFEESSGQNSRLCGIQGVLIVYLTQTSALWCSMLIYKLHLLAVWRSDFIDRYYGWLTAFCWIFPLGFAIPVAVKNLSQYPGMGFSCMTSTDNINTFLFYPTAVYIYPGLLCHAVTIAKMIHLAVMSSTADGLSQLSSDARLKITATAQAKRMVRGQWRPALMLGTVMTSLTVFWLFYFINAHRLTSISQTTPWVVQWITCIYTSSAQGLTSFETQTVCAEDIASNLPSITWFGAAELLLASLGIVIALVFVSKVDFWSDWSYVLSNIFRRGKLGNGRRGRGSTTSTKSPDIEQTPHRNPYADIHIRKGVYPSYGDTLPEEFVQEHRIMSPRDHTDGTQWYDMDDLLDKEYDIQDAGATNQSSKIVMQTRMEPPHYLSRDNNDPHSGDILYHPPVQERETNAAWMPTAPTPDSLSNAYLVANDTADRYIEQPVIPSPVPRASVKSKGDPLIQAGQLPLPPMQSIFLPDPTSSPTFAQISLSPMPPKLSYHTSTTSVSRQPQLDSIPIVGNTRGSLTSIFAEPSTSLSPSGPKVTQATRFNTREGVERTVKASGESLIGRSPSRNQQPQLLSQQGSDSVHSRKNNTPSALDLRASSPPPPSIPAKSPARLTQYQPYFPGQQY